MNSSRIEQIGTPQGIYNHPANTFVANFLGFNNLVPGTILSKEGQLSIDTSLGCFTLNQDHLSVGTSAPGESPYNKFADGQCATLFIRPDGASLDEGGDIYLHGTVVEHTFRGRMYLTRIEINGSMLVFEFPSSVTLPPPAGDITIGLNPSESFQILPNC
jgi:ABC-type Fe3+/spermidine/putrescine transport system ATPase subunit